LLITLIFLQSPFLQKALDALIWILILMTRLLLCTATILALTVSANAFTCDPSEWTYKQSICDWSLSQAKNPLCKQRPKTQEECQEREDKIWAVYDRWEEYGAWKKRKARKK
jgi:hypothetical protein